MAELDLSQIVQWLDVDAKASGQVVGFKQDSRQVLPGELFFAIKGERVDGHDYLRQAAAKGAIGAIVSKGYRGKDFGMVLIEVENVVAALQKLSKAVHSKRSTCVIGVTGSVGKTTTKEFIATLLERKYRVGKTPGNANSQVGVPLSILNSSGDEEVFVMEMGMSCPHEIERLIDVAPPKISIITKIALAHSEFFPDGLEGIAAAKAEILSHPMTHLGILNHQVAEFTAVKTSGPSKITYGLEKESCNSDFILCREKDHFYVEEKGWRTPLFKLPFTASHLCENFIGAASVARAMEIEWPEIIDQAQKLIVYKRRFETVEKQGIIFINDSYNANLTSMKAALANLPTPRAGKKKVAVLGAMKELGAYSEQSHYEVGKFALSCIDYLLCLGEECTTMVDIFQQAGRPVEYFLEFDSIKKRIFELAEEGDVVLLKGANSKKLWEILE